MSAGKGDSPRRVNGEMFRGNYDEIFRKDADDIVCPHCGSDNEPYFSRSVPMGFYCRDCGKDVDEKQSDQTISDTPNTRAVFAVCRERRER